MRWFTVFTQVCLSIAISACSSNQAPREPSAEDQIRAVIQQGVDAWNRKDANGYGAVYCPRQREEELSIPVDRGVFRRPPFRCVGRGLRAGSG